MGHKTRCRFCGTLSPKISEILGICRDCIISGGRDCEMHIIKIHRKVRKEYGQSPLWHLIRYKDAMDNVIQCKMCPNMCIIPEGNSGVCGLRENVNGVLMDHSNGGKFAICKWYYDALPTNCVANPVCSGCMGSSNRRHSYVRRGHAEKGYYNLAVFYGACNLSCLYCQNWHYRQLQHDLMPKISVSDLVSKVHDRVSCICYFGGDPSPQALHSIMAARSALNNHTSNILRICYETNGNVNRGILREWGDLASQSGGCIKIDIKAYNPNIYLALCGAKNDVVKENIKYLADTFCGTRDLKNGESPLLIVSQLLVPGYITPEDVCEVAKFIASIDESIPLVLLGFSPEFMMTDMPYYNGKDAILAKNLAYKEGLKYVYIENPMLFV